jgi:hypothetical protein
MSRSVPNVGCSAALWSAEINDLPAAISQLINPGSDVPATFVTRPRRNPPVSAHRPQAAPHADQRDGPVRPTRASPAARPRGDSARREASAPRPGFPPHGTQPPPGGLLTQLAGPGHGPVVAPGAVSLAAPVRPRRTLPRTRERRSPVPRIPACPGALTTADNTADNEACWAIRRPAVQSHNHAQQGKHYCESRRLISI